MSETDDSDSEDLPFDEDMDIFETADDARDALYFSSEVMSPAGFNALRDDPGAWAACAKNLLEAATVLQLTESRANVAKMIEHASAGSEGLPKDIRTFDGPRLLLVGYAIENLLKALIVANGTALLPGQLDKLLSHDLANLATTAAVQVTAQERVFLANMTKFVEWSGRYPLATSPRKTPRLQSGGSGAFEVACTLFDRLWGIYEKGRPPTA